MGSSVTWRGGTGGWNSAQQWSGFHTPTSADSVTIGSGSVDIASGVMALAATITLPGGMLRVDAGGLLQVAGTVAPSGGTLAIAGTLSGGTLAAGGTVLGQDGTLDGITVQGGLVGLGGLTVTTATVAANVAHAIVPAGTLTLAAGTYGGATFQLDQAAAVGNTVELDAAAGHAVILAASTQIGSTGPGVAGVTEILGGGTLTNQGTIALAPATTLESQIVYQPTGKFHSLVGTEMTWTQSTAPTLDIAAARFINTGLVALSGGTLELTGTSFRNLGTISLTDASAQTLQQGGDGMVNVVTTTLATHVDVSASTTDFVNLGTIAADSIAFDGAIGLARLGKLTGALSFAGTLSLGGGTLTATSLSPVTISGTIQHGILAAGAGHAALANATLGGVTIGGTATAVGTIHVLGLGGLTVGAGASLQAGASGDAVVFAGPSGGAIANGGTITAVAGTTMTLQAGLAGAGTIELGTNAAVTISALALLAKPRFLFDPGASLLSLPGHGAGVTLTNLHAGDVLDLRDISSLPKLPGAQGTAYEIGNTLDVIGASGQSALFALSAPSHGIGFSVSADAHGGTIVTVT